VKSKVNMEQPEILMKLEVIEFSLKLEVNEFLSFLKHENLAPQDFLLLL
jgi:hypothetical protein